MPEHADESAEYDWLLAFPSEPGGKPPESTESVPARVARLEVALLRSTSEVESLKSELATLVTSIDDIRKAARRHTAWAPKPVPAPRSRFVTATLGVVFGLALGLLGWTFWSRSSIGTISAIDTIEPTAAAWVPLAEEPRVDATSPPKPIVSLAAATPQLMREPAPAVAKAQRVTEAAPSVAKALRVQTPVDYVGTLSIEAAPGGQVFLDREPAGQTPLRIENLKAGSHLVWIEREGYRRFTRVVQVAADRVSRISAELEPNPER